MKSKTTRRNARQQAVQAFFRAIRQEQKWTDGGTMLLNLYEAADYLSWRVLSAECAADKGTISKRKADAEVAAVMAEIDAKTKGQPFRLDTHVGPLFVQDSLWRFAGRCGHVRGPNHEPTWDGDWRDAAGDAAAEAEDRAALKLKRAA